MRAPGSIAAACALALLLAPAVSRAQGAASYPDQPVHVVVPFPAGGPADILARTVGQRLGERLHQPFVIENRPGADTTVAAARVAKLPADGYTLFVVMDVTMVLNPITNKNLPYDPAKDFDPITLLSKNTSLLSVRADDGAKTLADLVARGKANPGKLNFGAGILTTRLGAELFNREMGIVAQYVPFQGSPPTVLGLMNGSVDYIVDGAATSLPLIQAGKLRALAKLNNGPVAGHPELKSLAEEAKAPALEDVSTWIGLVAPAGAPRAIIDTLQSEVRIMYGDKDFAAGLAKAGINIANTTPEEFSAFIKRERERWTKVIADIGYKAN